MESTEATAGRTAPRRGQPPSVLLLVVVVAVAALWSTPAVAAVSGWGPWERRTLDAPFLTAAVGYFVVPLLLAWAIDQDLGLHHAQPARWLEVACMSLGVVGPLVGGAFSLGARPRYFPLAAVIAAVYLLCVPLMMWLLRKTRAVRVTNPLRKQLLVCGAVVALAVAIAAAPGHAPTPLEQSLYLLVMVGLGEELLFRGLLQGALDAALGTPWTLGRARLGWGWVIQAVLFGVSHPLLAGDASLWGWGLWSTASGLVFGWIRARAGTICAPAVVHGVTDVIGVVLVPLLIA